MSSNIREALIDSASGWRNEEGICYEYIMAFHIDSDASVDEAQTAVEHYLRQAHEAIMLFRPEIHAAHLSSDLTIDRTRQGVIGVSTHCLMPELMELDDGRSVAEYINGLIIDRVEDIEVSCYTPDYSVRGKVFQAVHLDTDA